ncbi:MAG TPA: oleate hydratase, partial [Balneolaceae bacterium]|nr:oleate hydratase [Balneolaceae bacterium]
MQKKHVIIIGAGIGGLASACLLARSGYRVTVLEKNQTPGGKMQQYSRDGFRFDTGPSLLTMPFLLERLFETCSFSMHEYLTLTELPLLCRYTYPDGTRFDTWPDRQKTREEIRRIAPEDEENYIRFLN